MTDAGDLEREVAHLRTRLSLLSQASLRINESLDVEAALQGVLDSARALTRRHLRFATVLWGWHVVWRRDATPPPTQPRTARRTGLGADTVRVSG